VAYQRGTLIALALTTEGFIKRAKNVHGEKFGYTHVNYVNRKTVIKLQE